MNKATLDKATEKILDKMTPIELATYANELAQQQAKKLETGNVTVDRADKEVDQFVKTHVNTLSPNSYIQYMDALHRETEKSFVVLLTESHLKNFDLRMTITELAITTMVSTEPVYFLLLRKQYPKDVAEKMIDEAIEERRLRAAEYFKQLEDIKKEQEEYLAHPAWAKYGVSPVVKERVSLLLPDVVSMYAP